MQKIQSLRGRADCFHEFDGFARLLAHEIRRCLQRARLRTAAVAIKEFARVRFTEKAHDLAVQKFQHAARSRGGRKEGLPRFVDESGRHRFAHGRH